MEKIIRFIFLIAVVLAVSFGFYKTWGVYIDKQNNASSNAKISFNILYSKV